MLTQCYINPFQTVPFSTQTKDPWGEDPMKEVPTKIKSAFTRAFNQAGHAARCSLQLEEPKKGRWVVMSRVILQGAGL